VVLYHAGIERFSGGFVRVDVFFVISGYLITGIILTELEAGTFRFRDFYARRARRILPALFLVVAACIPFVWLWLPPTDVADFARSTLYLVTFTSNFFFFGAMSAISIPPPSYSRCCIPGASRLKSGSTSFFLCCWSQFSGGLCRGSLRFSRQSP
ncbi:MAG: acyltransferase, partial [Pseudomonadota bacterium]